MRFTMHTHNLKTAIIVLAVIFTASDIAAQSIGLSKPGRLNIVKEFQPAELALVSNSIEMVYSDDDTCWVAGKECKIRFKVQNIGEQTAKNASIKIDCPNLPEDVVISQPTIRSLAPDAVTETEIKMTSSIKFVSDTLSLSISSDIPSGINTKLLQLDIEKKGFVPPSVQIVDYAATKSNEYNTIDRKGEFNLQVLIQNTKSGLAENVHVSLELPYGVFLVSDELSPEIVQLAPGEQKTVQFTLMLIGEYYKKPIPITIKTSEKWNLFGDSSNITLKIGQKLSEKWLSEKRTVTVDKKPNVKHKKNSRRKRKGGRK